MHYYCQHNNYNDIPKEKKNIIYIIDVTREFETRIRTLLINKEQHIKLLTPENIKQRLQFLSYIRYKKPELVESSSKIGIFFNFLNRRFDQLMKITSFLGDKKYIFPIRELY